MSLKNEFTSHIEQGSKVTGEKRSPFGHPAGEDSFSRGGFRRPFPSPKGGCGASSWVGRGWVRGSNEPPPPLLPGTCKCSQGAFLPSCFLVCRLRILSPTSQGPWEGVWTWQWGYYSPHPSLPFPGICLQAAHVCLSTFHFYPRLFLSTDPK